MAIQQPATRPANPRFSSGPCAKPPTFDLAKLSDAPLGRSHRAALAKQSCWPPSKTPAKFSAYLLTTRSASCLPPTLARIEMAMWNLLGERHVEMLAWESFGSGWVTDAVKQLKIDATVQTADYGEIVDLTA